METLQTRCFSNLLLSSFGEDFEISLLSFEKLDRASPDLWPEQLPGVAEFAATCKNPITTSPPKWMAELESEDIEMLKELGSLTTANLMEKVKGLQNLAYQLGLEECKYNKDTSPLGGAKSISTQFSAAEVFGCFHIQIPNRLTSLGFQNDNLAFFLIFFLFRSHLIYTTGVN
uniref:Protein lin-52 homolog n=1 Tax=Oryzias latipes TaxID=8090 RepID=A0A3B3IF81_ORYLA